MKFGVVFASTGGPKILRAIRSLRRSEPELPLHVVIDTSSGTWKSNSDSLMRIEAQPNVKVRCVTNTAYINGILNAGMRWMAELGFDYGCLFHDDVVFSPLSEHRGHLSELFGQIETTADLRRASGLSLSLMQAFVPKVWRRSPAEWDTMDLESESLWRTLWGPARSTPIQWRPTPWSWTELVTEAPYKIHLPTFYVQGYAGRASRLGPSGQIVPVATWEAIGGFDEKDGIFYDIQYPAECAVRKLPAIVNASTVPHLHLHNQSIGFGDLASGIWNDTMGAFTKRYGEYEKFWERELMR